jgi:hypothetical protein
MLELQMELDKDVNAGLDPLFEDKVLSSEIASPR